tara:strand:+ start:4219 stop:4773 length:555 start_codon:yes stop_codon:yes gene_type:complete
MNKILDSEAFNKSIPKDFLDELNNRVIKITLKDISYSLAIKFENNTINLIESSENHDVELVAASFTFMMFILSRGSDSFSSKIKINGDVDTANRFNSFVSNSEKLRDITKHIIGSDKAEYLESMVGNISESVNSFLDESSSTLIDFFQDDLEVLPRKEEIEQYLNDVDDLKSRTNKLYKKYKNV